MSDLVDRLTERFEAEWFAGYIGKSRDRLRIDRLILALLDELSSPTESMIAAGSGVSTPIITKTGYSGNFPIGPTSAEAAWRAMIDRALEDDMRSVMAGDKAA